MASSKYQLLGFRFNEGSYEEITAEEVWKAYDSLHKISRGSSRERLPIAPFAITHGDSFHTCRETLLYGADVMVNQIGVNFIGVEYFSENGVALTEERKALISSFFEFLSKDFHVRLFLRDDTVLFLTPESTIVDLSLLLWIFRSTGRLKYVIDVLAKEINNTLIGKISYSKLCNVLYPIFMINNGFSDTANPGFFLSLYCWSRARGFYFPKNTTGPVFGAELARFDYVYSFLKEYYVPTFENKTFYLDRDSGYVPASLRQAISSLIHFLYDDLQKKEKTNDKKVR